LVAYHAARRHRQIISWLLNELRIRSGWGSNELAKQTSRIYVFVYVLEYYCQQKSKLTSALPYRRSLPVFNLEVVKSASSLRLIPLHLQQVLMIVPPGTRQFNRLPILRKSQLSHGLSKQESHVHRHLPRASTVARKEHEQKSWSSSKTEARSGHDETSALLMR
jgi:hypothetical protein